MKTGLSERKLICGIAFAMMVGILIFFALPVSLQPKGSVVSYAAGINTFDNIDALKKASNVNVGDTVKTNGFYRAGDGGKAQYSIVQSSSFEEDSCRLIKLNNGLCAEMIIKNNTVTAESFGAIGDGQSDDAPYIQKIIDYGYNVQLTKGKTYKFISSGIYISNPVSIKGNGANFLLDDSYAPVHHDFDSYFIRNKYNESKTSFEISNLNINVNFASGRATEKSFVVISPLYIDALVFDGVSVETSDSKNSIVCMWLNNGCDSFILRNSRLINNTIGETGGALWITTKEDKFFQKYKELKQCRITNTELFTSSADEVLGIWGIYNINATISKTKINGDIKAGGRTRVISVMSQGDNNANLNVVFNDCAISANGETEKTNSYYDSVLGIGTDYSSNKINVSFKKTRINGNVFGSLIFPSCYRSKYVSRFDGNSRNVSIIFSDCDIKCKYTITGNSMDYYNTGAEYPTFAWDCTFNRCNIDCGIAFAYLYTPGDGNYYVPRIELNKCKLVVNNADAFICKPRPHSEVALSMTSTTITAAGVQDIFTLKNDKVKNLVYQANPGIGQNISDVTLNGKIIGN